MSQHGQVTGPGFIYVGVGSAYAPVLLGTAEVSPRIEIQPAVVPYFNNIAGPNVPMDLVDVGQQAFVFCDMNRLESSVMAKVQSRPNFGGTRGTQAAGAMGSFAIYEGYTYPLWVQFPYSAKSAMSDMEAGYHFFNAYMVGPDRLESIGMTPLKRMCVWHCLPTLSVGANNTVVSTLYDHSMSGLPAAT